MRKIRFNNETIIQLRDDIEKIICKNKDNLEDSNVRIHIDSDVLDRLLFDYDKEDNKKRPVWSGSFLRYIDLSEISFEDVCWSKIGRQKNSRYAYVVYCNINAKIDFSKSYEAKRYGGNYEIFNCDFSNTDLSNMNISKIFHVENCCFVNCHISGDIYDMRHVDIDNSDFSYNDLYGTISIEDFIDTFCDDNCCSFSGNRINIIYNRDDFNKSQLIKLGKIIKEGMISHCCVNGKEIKSFKERQEIASQMMNKYNAAVDSIKEDIIKQLTKAKE